MLDELISSESPTLQKLNSSNINNSIKKQSENSIKNKILVKTTENSILNNFLSLKNYQTKSKISGGKYKEDYFNSLINLNEKFSNPIIDINNKKSYDGFKSYEIPHIHNNRNSENYRINNFRDNLEKTIKYQKTYNNLDNIQEIINEEDLKLKHYLNRLNYFADFNSSKFPNLIQITNMEKLKTSSLKITNNRFMGPRYDPNNYS